MPEQTTTILEECALNGWHQSERCLAVMARTAIGQNQTQHISTNQMSSMVLEDWWGLFCNHRTCHLAVTLSHPWTLCIYQSILESSVRSSVWWLDQNWNDNDNDQWPHCWDHCQGVAMAQKTSSTWLTCCGGISWELCINKWPEAIQLRRLGQNDSTVIWEIIISNYCL